MTTPSQPTWQDQWHRVQRWYDDLRKTYEGRPASDGGTDWLRDHALAFFVFAFHLGDWLDHDQPINNPQVNGARTFARENPRLTWCRDLCNATKHLVLDTSGRYPPNAADTAMTGNDVTVMPGTIHARASVGGSPLPAIPNDKDSSSARHAFRVTGTVNGDVETHDAFDLATACMDAWRGYLGKRGLPTT